jgi:hypothetical protein
MSKLIAVLLMLGQFEVAVETSKGDFVRAYPDTDAGVTQFVHEIATALRNEPDRFYPCVAYDGPMRDVMSSELAQRIRVVDNLRTGLRDPGIADAPWIIRDSHIKAYRSSNPTEELDAKLVEKICLSLLPRNYMQLYPAKTGINEFYR